jgi:hypothetical protein
VHTVVDVRPLSHRCSLQVANIYQDLDALHDEIEEIDVGFTSVPISDSDVSMKLCLAHAKRVISSQLQDIIWQPFSSEITLEDSNHIALLSLICEGLAKSTHEGRSGPRAARICTALVMRSLQSQSTSTTRAERFTDKVMEVLKLLVKPDQHSNLRKDLLDLATSAVTLWNTAQTDVREIKVHDTLDPADFEEWDEDIPSSNNGVIVLFPRITVRDYSRIEGTRPVGPPGKRVESHPAPSVEEIFIHHGEGLAEWSALVEEGEEEEEERKEKQEEKILEEKKRILEENLKKLERPSLGGKRKMNHSRRESMIGVGSHRSSPSPLAEST